MILLKPKADDTYAEFSLRLYNDVDFNKAFPGDLLKQVTYSLWRCNSKDSGMWPKTYKCNFIEPGLVYYREPEEATILVTKQALDKMAQSFVGKPVVNMVHREVEPKDFSEGNVDGIVTKVWYNEADGWYWAEFIVWDQSTKRNCESNAYSVSCAYVPSKLKEVANGTHNNIPYDMEVLGGEYTHLAVVANPRYEGARIIYNSKGGSEMFKFWKGNGKEKTELKNITDSAVVMVDGKEVSIKKLIEVYNTGEKTVVQEDAIVEIDGKEVSVKDLVAGYKAVENADDKKDDDKDKDEKEHKNGLHKEKRMQNCALCNAEDKDEDEKKKKEKENADEDDEKKKKDDEKKNSEDAEGKEHFDDLKNAATVRGQASTPSIILSREDMFTEGSKKYGPKALAK